MPRRALWPAFSLGYVPLWLCELSYLTPVRLRTQLQLLMTAGQNSEVYNIGSKQLLISVTRGWVFNDVLKFALSRPEVAKVVYNNKEYFPGQFGENEDEL